MMNKRTIKIPKTGVFLLLATMTLIFAAAALAQGSGGRFDRGQGRDFGGGKFNPEKRLEMLEEKLDLTEEQVTAIEKIHQAGREEKVALRKEMMRLKNELEGELLKDEPSEKTALNLVEKIGALKTAVQANRLKSKLEVRQLLTPEQRDKMLMLRGKSDRGHCRRGGHRGGHFRGGECDGSGPQGSRGARG